MTLKYEEDVLVFPFGKPDDPWYVFDDNGIACLVRGDDIHFRGGLAVAGPYDTWTEAWDYVAECRRESYIGPWIAAGFLATVVVIAVLGWGWFA